MVRSSGRPQAASLDVPIGHSPLVAVVQAEDELLEEPSRGGFLQEQNRYAVGPQLLEHELTMP